MGPFTGATLQVTEPPFDKATNLKLWADGPRVTVCFTELVEGLLFKANPSTKQAELRFANLQASNVQRKTLVKLRAPGKSIFKKQLDLVAAYADLRADRASEIVAELPFPLPFWASVIGLSAHRHGKTLQLLDLAFSLAFHVEMRFKHIFAISRPVEHSPQIQPMVPTPGHGSWPSGHATEAFLVATLMESLLNAASPSGGTRNGRASREQLQRLAARIAVNRTVAGLHYPVDSAAGRLLGTSLAEYLVARANGGKVHERGFDGRLFEGPNGAALDFSLQDPMDHTHGNAYTRSAASTPVAKGPLVEWLWKEAIKEWA